MNQIMGSNLSILATLALLRASFHQLIPPELRILFWQFRRRFASQVSIVVKETHDGSANHLFKALVTYLGTAAAASNAPRRLTAGKNESTKSLTYGIDQNSEITDDFHGVQFKWGFYTDTNSNSNSYSTAKQWYELRFHKKHSDLVKNKYLPYILETAKRITDSNKVVKLYTTRWGVDGWNTKGMNLDHPMTFETLAMDGDLKERVIEDLEGFMRGKEYYKKIGKVWKRGYLLYGPPGTGKSSLIAAMANYLNYDIYNLNLSVVLSDSSLEHLLLHMSNRSLLVVEDIDCSVVLHNRVAPDRQPGPSTGQLGGPQITLLGLLNAIDGLLSCCGDERIIVFTTNYKDRIDPALLRAGRMDMHIYLSYCTFSTFKQLAFNYLDILDHPLFSHIEKLIGEVEATPAEVAGELMKIRSPFASLENLIKFLENKKAEAKLASEGTEMKIENDNATPVKEEKNRVKEECGSIRKSIFSKYGDIGANNVGDLQSVGLEFARLQQKLDAILQALPVDQKGTRPFEKMDESPKFDDDGAEALKGALQETGSDAKLNSFWDELVIDGLH